VGGLGGVGRQEAVDLIESEAFEPYCRALTSWGSERLSPAARKHAIEELYNRPTWFNALAAVPVPVPLEGQHACAARCSERALNHTHTYKDAGGLLSELAITGSKPLFKEGSHALTADFGVGLALPPRIFPAQGLLFLRQSIDSDARTTLAVGARYRQFFAIDFGLFLEANGALGGNTDRFVGTWFGGAGYLHRNRTFQIGGTGAVGYDGLSKYNVSLSFVLSRVE